jgi:F-type H+-transporting ATPase subunit c
MMLADAVVQTTQALQVLHGNIGVGLVGCGAAIGIGLAGLGAALAIGRNPNTFGKVFTVMLLGMALAEGLAMLTFFLLANK